MHRRIALVTVVVPDYEEALRFYVGTLGFSLMEDAAVDAAKRWVVVRPGDGAALLLARAADERQRAAVGNQTGGRVGFFLHTDDLGRDRSAWEAAGVPFEGATRVEPYGTVAVFRDPFGNRWDLIEPAG